MPEQYNNNAATAAEVRSLVRGKGWVPEPIPFLEHVNAQAVAIRDEANGGGDVMVVLSAIINRRKLARYGLGVRDLMDSVDPTDFGEFDIQAQAYAGDLTENPWQDLGYAAGFSGAWAGGVAKSFYPIHAPPNDDEDPDYVAQTEQWLQNIEQYPIITTRLVFANALGAGPAELFYHDSWTGHVLINVVGGLGAHVARKRRWTSLYVPVHLSFNAAYVAP